MDKSEEVVEKGALQIGKGLEIQEDVDDLRKLLVWLYFFTNHTKNIPQDPEQHIHECSECGECTLFDSRLRYLTYKMEHYKEGYFSECLSNKCL